MPALALVLAGNAAQLSDEVTLYTHGNEEATAAIAPLAAAVKAKNFNVDPRPIKRFYVTDNGNSITIEFTDGSTKEETLIVHSPKTSVQGPFVEQLGLALTPTGDVVANPPFFQTSVRGVFAAGDIVTPYKAANAAVYSGCNAAVACVAQLQGEKYGLPAMF
jgi:thioredoxin reductase